eukprot:9752093-Alexandrium_andersonii.AAC.1
MLVPICIERQGRASKGGEEESGRSLSLSVQKGDLGAPPQPAEAPVGGRWPSGPPRGQVPGSSGKRRHPVRRARARIRRITQAGSGSGTGAVAKTKAGEAPGVLRHVGASFTAA